MKKRCIAIVLLPVLFALLISTLAAYADIYIGPRGLRANNFYRRNENKCVPLYRSFYMNGKSGSVSVTENPGSGRETAVIENGEKLVIMFTYNHNGKLWGGTEGSRKHRITGWVPMDQLMLEYDDISFTEEHKNEFYPYTGDYEALKKVKEVVPWSWPGAGTKVENFRGFIVFSFNIEFSDVYKDEQGRKWGKMTIPQTHPYLYSDRDQVIWICISDPENNQIPAFNPPRKIKWKP